MFRTRQEDHRLRLRVHKPAKNDTATSRTITTITRLVRIFKCPRASAYLVTVRHKGTLLGRSNCLVYTHQPKWKLTSIQLDNDAATVMRVIALTIASVAPAPTKPWDQRIVLGCWAAKFLPLCAEHLPTYPISHIGFSLSYAQQFLRTPNISFNILQRSLLNPFSGRSFLRSAKRANRPVLCWTVNQENMMRWGIQEGLDGVVTDDPERFLRVEEDWESGGEGRVVRMSWKDLGLTMWINLMVLIFGVIFRWRYPDGKKTGSSSGAGTKSTTPI